MLTHAGVCRSSDWDLLSKYAEYEEAHGAYDSASSKVVLNLLAFLEQKVQILTHKALQDATFQWETLSPKWRRLQCTIASLNYVLDTSPSPHPRLLHLHPRLGLFDAHSHTQRDHSLRPRPDSSPRNVAFARNGGVAYGGEAYVFSPFRYADVC
jgi:hypothetical protein